jgi:hypothetical protein
MKLKVSRAEAWTATIEDRAGGAAQKLEPLAAAGANFEFVLVRRTPEQPGKGIMFVAPLRGKKVVAAAQAAGFARPAEIHVLRIEGGDKPGLGARLTQALAGAGVSFRGLVGTVLGRKFVAWLALDSAGDADRALRAIGKLR